MEFKENSQTVVNVGESFTEVAGTDVVKVSEIASTEGSTDVDKVSETASTETSTSSKLAKSQEAIANKIKMAGETVENIKPADRIPEQYVSIVKKSLIAAAGVSPLGLFGTIDAVGVGAVWATMFLAIRKKAGSTLGADPKRICAGVASGIARYYIGCKAATFAFFLVPGIGPIAVIAAGIGISGVCNIYFTYSFAATLIELFEKQIYKDDEIIKFFINHLKRLPTVDEVKEIYRIYKS